MIHLNCIAHSVQNMRLQGAYLFYNFCLMLLAPPACAYCAILLPEREVFCKTCVQKIRPIVSKSIAITPSKHMTVFAITDYKDPLKKLILAKRWPHDVASYQLGQLIGQYTPIKDMPYDCIVPIPLHWTRYAYRGFNQAEIIASVLAQQIKKPMVHLLKRTVCTTYQAGLTQEKRHKNVHDVFTLNENVHVYSGKHLLLVDDLMTTGATLKAAARELLKVKPASITAVVACRVI
jgi:ComF family protein